MQRYENSISYNYEGVFPLTQTQHVIKVLRKLGGFATFGKLNSSIDSTSWKTKTPEATVRRIVQDSDAFFRIQPGLWALVECRAKVLRLLNLDIDASVDELPDKFTHSYYQGLIIEIGNMRKFDTFLPSQDKNKKFLGTTLKELASLQDIHKFTYEEILKYAQTVDAIWFNERNMPKAFFEVENTTDMKNSLSKFFELQDFHSKFFIVAPKYRHSKFIEDINRSIFKEIRERVQFIAYEKISEMHTQEHRSMGIRFF